MSKIVLDSEPNLSFDRCPFMQKDRNECILSRFCCRCVGGYYDSLSFDFDECPFCTTLDKVYKECHECALPLDEGDMVEMESYGLGYRTEDGEFKYFSYVDGEE